MTKSQYLQEVLETYRMSHVQPLVDKHLEKRQEIKEALEAKYGSSIYTPLNSGSYAKHTAINKKFDLDVMIPFKRNAFNTLEAMFQDVLAFLENKYYYTATVKDQTVSIGIDFNADRDGEVVSIDVVPGRELNANQYPSDKNLNLNINSRGNRGDSQSYIQTNIHAQIEHIKSKENERKIIRLLKIWKTTNNEKYKSFLLELITIKAFENTNTYGNLWDKLKAVMEYIKDNVTRDNFTLKDPGNSGNNVINTLNSYERSLLSSRMQTMLNSINRDADNLKVYFPKNTDGFGFKPNTNGSSRPPKNERFG